jgi:hypothetical protein
MEWADVVAAVRAWLDAEWSAAPVAWPNESFDQPHGEPWLYAEVLPSDTESTAFGSAGLRIVQDHGVIGFHVFVPNGTGVDAAFRIARTVGELFRLQTLAAGVETGAPQVGGSGQGDDDGNWFRVSVSIPVTSTYTA